MAGLDVVTLSSPDCLSGLRAQGLTRRDRRRAAAREARAREELARAPPPPPPTPNSTPRNRPRRELAGRRSCAGCNQAPCARSAAGCFRGVGQANGKYVVRGLDHERYPTAELAARRRDMLLAAGACRSFDEPLNFERSDAKQLKFERDFAAKERKESRKRARSHDDDAPPAPSPRSSVPAASPRPRRGEHIEAPTSLGQEIDLLHPMRMAGRVGKRMVHQGVGAVGRQVSAESRQQEHDRLAIKRGACADRARSAPPRFCRQGSSPQRPAARSRR